MLDTTTKKRIDDCRDILVGKLPDPKAQIEQITIGLIYKFMDDMDKEAIELGGKAKFFSNYTIPDPKNPGKEILVDFEKYRWDNLFDTRVTASEMLTLYSEAIAGMDKNPNIPQLFRDIFKNAFLPYRDPETLKLFLKTIGEFEYTHSEKLGDAFEYLLSVMGSQGDAGQFRTPRHIIDFLVKVVNPQKTDTILDPACGTAGFLISAFKHTMQSDTPLTPDERRRIINNFRGYDISPDMVRLSLVNLYLHGFSDPHIYEYDTLTSEDRWNETFDVILANPPFMSPKGGIRPHKKFSVTSNRSEVLFVDYIAEHLNPKGRAGIIVPEGVIFQSGTAYKELRRMLVENYLYAVVSLPAGVFNPYSGVKTSILLMDKALAKTCDKILFVKIDNDGYGLGAQRNPVKGGQLEEAVEIIRSFCNGEDIETRVPVETRLIASLQAHVVPKPEIAKNGDYNLSGERYRFQISIESEYPMVELKEVAEVISGQSPNSEFYNDKGEGLPFYQGKTEFGSINIGAPTKWTTEITKEAFINDILMSVRAPVGPVNFATQHICIGRGLAAIRAKKAIKKEFLFYLLKSQENTIKGNGGAVFDSISRNQIEQIQIPLPPLSVQEEIVAEIEGYQKIIDGAKMVVENYKPKIDIGPEWEMVELGEVCERITDGTHQTPDYKDEGEIFLSSKNVISQIIDWENIKYISKEAHKENTKNIKPQFNDILLAKNGVNSGNAAIVDKDLDFSIYVSLALLRPKVKIINPTYLLRIINTQNTLKQFQSRFKGVGVPNLHLSEIKQVKIPLPDFKTQNQIVSQIEKEQALVNANKQLIALFEQKIKDRIAKVWGTAPGSETKGLYAENGESLSVAAEGKVGYGG